MSNVSEWSVTAGSNNASPPNGWPEGMQRSAVNDAARELMAALAKWYQDQLGSLVLAGGTTAYTLTTNNAHAALSDIPLMAVRVNAANTGAVTLAVDGLAAKSVMSGGAALSSGAFSANQLILIAYNPNLDVFEVLGPPGVSEIASGTLMLFQQTSAPSGWTKQTTHNDKALRVVSGSASSGGTTAFSGVFAARTIAQANLPNVTLTGTAASSGAHTHPYSRRPNNTSVEAGAGASVCDNGTTTDNTGSEGAHTHSVTTSSINGGVSQTAMDFAVQYVDLIIASKN